MKEKSLKLLKILPKLIGQRVFWRGMVMEIYMKAVKVCGGRNFWLSQQ